MKLEDLKKKNIYTVPDNYFDQLPTRIQSRINEKRPASWLNFNWSLTYKLAAPVLAVLFLVFYFGRSDRQIPQDAESLLARVNTDEIIAYIDFMDISTDEIIESIDLNGFDFIIYEEQLIGDDLETEDIKELFDAYGLEEEIL